MTHQLREAFRDLAESADHVSPLVGAPAGTHDLWRRGRRARRRRVASSVLVTGAVMALLGAVLPVVGGQLRATPAPASYDETALAVPDQIWAPSSWAPTADAENPPGPLAMVASAPRRGLWPFSREHQWFGVSAVDQSYSWLDLPGQATSEGAQAISLSPDGRQVAYFLGGSPPGPRTEVSDPWTASEPQSDVVGFAVLDLVSGEVARHRVPTRFGLSVTATGVDSGLVWSQDSAWLVANYGQYMRTPGGSRFPLTEAWRPADGAVRTLLESPSQVESLAAGPGGTVVGWHDHRDELLSVSLGTSERRVNPVPLPPADMSPGAPSFNSGGTRMAFVGARKEGVANWPAAFAGPVSSDREVGELTMLDKGWMPQEVLGWLDDTRVLVQGHRRNDTVVQPPLRVLAWDVTDGTTSAGIVRPSSSEELDRIEIATELLGQPLRAAERPGIGLPPWPVAAAIGLLLSGIAVALLQRARGPRDVRMPADGSAR